MNAYTKRQVILLITHIPDASHAHIHTDKLILSLTHSYVFIAATPHVYMYRVVTPGIHKKNNKKPKEPNYNC